jgi:YVTN family beta-propeller protein
MKGRRTSFCSARLLARGSRFGAIGYLAFLAFSSACLISAPQGFAQNAYITNRNSDSVSVIDTASNALTATIPVGVVPYGVAASPNGTKVYVANELSNSVSVIDTATNTVTATVTVGSAPYGVAVTPDGSTVYVANYSSGGVSVIDTASNTMTATVTVGTNPAGVAVTPDGSKV